MLKRCSLSLLPRNFFKVFFCSEKAYATMANRGFKDLNLAN